MKQSRYVFWNQQMRELRSYRRLVWTRKREFCCRFATRIVGATRRGDWSPMGRHKAYPLQWI